MSDEQMTEAAFVKGIANGREWAFKKVFLAYYEPLCNFCWRYTKSKAISEDLVQEVFADLWQLRETLDSSRSLRVYLYQAVKNKALDYLDHQKVVRNHQENHRLQHERFSTQEQVAQEDKAFVKAVRQAIKSLPTRAQQAYILHREDGLTYSEIADVMDISVKTVESQISRALDILREQLRDNVPSQVSDNTMAKIFPIRSTGSE
ncbi:RNA polymerase sigma-70 factor [Halalkalibaculum sp. DA3122]|uniref:RNA polymerase sigma-70 factor n=1 Tax=unclassified Halalkalibaculum TaxID=2964617 RepID=UPI0037543438